MVAIPSRHRSLVLLTIVVVVQVLASRSRFNTQYRRREPKPGAVVERWADFSVRTRRRLGVGKVPDVAPLFCAQRYRAGERTPQAGKRCAEAADYSVARQSGGSDRLAKLLNFRESQEKVR